MRKYLYIICCVFLLVTCDKGILDQSHFDFTVSVNKTEYQLGETIEYQIDGGHRNAAIHLILAKYDASNQIEEYIDLFNHSSWYYDEHCCEPNLNNSYDGYCIVCNCDLNSTEDHEPTESWNGTEYATDDFYWGDNQYKILILDPFISFEGRDEYGECRGPNAYNIICESEPFYISTVSSNCSSPQSLNSTPSISSVDLNWNDVNVADRYHLRYRTSGGSWTTITGYIPNSEYSIDNLIPNTEYEWQVKTVCNYSGTELSDWSNNAFFTTISDSPCQTVNCSSLNQLSDYEAYTLFGSSNTANWIISNDGYIGNCLYTEGSCTGGYVKLTTNLSEPAIMKIWLKKGFGGVDWINYSVEVDGVDYPFSISQNSNSDSNWFVQVESNETLPSGYNEIKIDFGELFTTDNYYVDEIEFFCE